MINYTSAHEQWLPVPGYEGLYEVSDFGRVRRLPAMTLEEKYQALLDDVRSLASSFRSLQLQASDREAPAYEDAYEMASEVYETAIERELR